MLIILKKKKGTVAEKYSEKLFDLEVWMKNDRLREKVFLKCPHKSFPCMRAEAKDTTIMPILERNSKKANWQ